MVVEITSVLVALITGLASVGTAYCWGYVPKRRKEKIRQLQKELLEAYQNLFNLIEVEKSLEAESGISKPEARAGLPFTRKQEPARIKKRIAELESMLK